MKRTHTCGELRAEHIGTKATIQGWVNSMRTHGGLIFINLRDRYGITQTVFNPENNKEIHKLAESVKREYVLEISGKVQNRIEGQTNKDMPTGDIEIMAEQMTVLNESDILPLEVEDNINATEDTRMKHRYLDLRRQPMQSNIITRYRITKTVRDYLDNNSFIEIETPVLAKSTPEGARDYLVPSRVHPHSFFALPQSPQQYKQLLMISGFDRYFQIVKCFRDEDLRGNRQPEFTQIDIEMSFVDKEDIFTMIQGLMKHLFKDILNTDIEESFPKMTYHDAMAKYGSDKPDTRFNLELVDISEIAKDCGFGIFKSAIESGGKVACIIAPKDFSRKEIETLEAVAKIYDAKGLAWMKMQDSLESGVSKFFDNDTKAKIINTTGAKKGETLLFVADHKHHIVQTALGQLRLHLGKQLKLIDEKQNNLLWITDFPLLEYDEDEQRHIAVHHPFTAPKEDHMKFLDSEPQKALSEAYDLVWNGEEIAGGSIRIHQKEIQEKMFTCLGISKEEADDKFSMLLEAFRYGAPPHGGIAFGFDRLVGLFTNNDNIREVIAFPKNNKCIGVMEGSPSKVDNKQLDELGIALKKAV